MEKRSTIKSIARDPKTLQLEEKTYDFWAPLTSGILQRKVDDKDSILKKMELPENHPKNIAQSIAMKEIPATKDLVKQSLSRFENPK